MSMTRPTAGVGGEDHVDAADEQAVRQRSRPNSTAAILQAARFTVAMMMALKTAR
jgi:hypothetical protein